MQPKHVLFEFTGTWDAAKPFYVEAITAGFTRFVARPEHVPPLRGLGKVEVIAAGVASDPDFLLVDGGAAGGVAEPSRACALLSLASKADEELAIHLARAGFHAVIVDATDWKVIPLENLIAAFQETGTLLFARVRSEAEARLFLETLERGTDGVLLALDAASTTVDTMDFPRWKALISPAGHVDLVDATITRIEEVGSGDRVCVDTISMLLPGEGMLVGNHARGFFLVHGEVADTEFVNARPFRVNAGAVHSYVLRPGNKTGYLSELAAGASVMIVDHLGNTRETKVGRAKIETRPMLLVEATHDDQIISAILQNAETICLVTPGGAQRSISKLQVGDIVRIHVSGSKGRHFGKDIEEKMIEK